MYKRRLHVYSYGLAPIFHFVYLHDSTLFAYVTLHSCLYATHLFESSFFSRLKKALVDAVNYSGRVIFYEEGMGGNEQIIDHTPTLPNDIPRPF